jgi:hypothetical protein
LSQHVAVESRERTGAVSFVQNAPSRDTFIQYGELGGALVRMETDSKTVRIATIGIESSAGARQFCLSRQIPASCIIGRQTVLMAGEVRYVLRWEIDTHREIGKCGDGQRDWVAQNVTPAGIETGRSPLNVS